MEIKKQYEEFTIVKVKSFQFKSYFILFILHSTTGHVWHKAFFKVIRTQGCSLTKSKEGAPEARKQITNNWYNN